MNKVFGFIKANLIVVISVVLILVLLPAGYIFASKWNAKVQSSVKSAYDSEKRSLTSSGSVNYAVPAVLTGEQDLSESRAPNAVVTKFYEQAKAAREEQVKDVVERGTAFNRGNHVELVPGLLPDAGDARTRARLVRSMNEAVVGSESNPSVYQRKLKRLNAGSPPDQTVMSQILEQYKAQLEQEYKSTNADGNLTEDQKKRLDEAMTARRLSEYVDRASSLTFYATTDAFVNGSPTGETTTVGRDGFSIIPAANWLPSQISESVAFTWLWDYWVISDLLDAAALANSNAASGAMSIPEAPVKRIDFIRVSAFEVAAEVASDDQGSSTGRPVRGGAVDDVQSTAQVNFTGREGGKPNSAFDIRKAQLVAVVSSKDLPKFLDAIGKVNFMTVTDLNLQSVDIWDELKQGYYYGQDHVVRVSLTIETVWLRSWMTPLMPNPVRKTLGVPALQSQTGDADDMGG